MIRGLESSWRAVLNDYVLSNSFKSLLEFVEEQYRSEKAIYPKQNDVFNAFENTSFEDVSVVILGQDPYHGKDQAMGLSFSVPEIIKNPPSLRNIFKELELEYSKKSEAESKHSGDLTCWADQGVLLLNSVLTVEARSPGSHSKKGWEDFTDNVIKTISNNKQHIVFLLWGNYAKTKVELIDSSKHLILTSSHPSPLSAYKGFFGCDHFKKTNRYLIGSNKTPITW
jgi:uracil-DNA glycosylase